MSTMKHHHRFQQILKQLSKYSQTLKKKLQSPITQARDKGDHEKVEAAQQQLQRSTYC